MLGARCLCLAVSTLAELGRARQMQGARCKVPCHSTLILNWAGCGLIQFRLDCKPKITQLASQRKMVVEQDHWRLHEEKGG